MRALPPRPVLPATPPWRKKSRTPSCPPPEDRGKGPPSWISDIRAQVENTRELFLDSPSRPRKAPAAAEISEPVGPEERRLGAPLASTPPKRPGPKTAWSGHYAASSVDRTEGIPAWPSPPLPNHSPIEPRPSSEASVVFEVQPTTTQVPSLAAESEPRPSSEASVVLEAPPTSTKVPSVAAESEDEEDDGDALIAWSQGLCIADFEQSVEPGDALAAALARLEL